MLSTYDKWTVLHLQRRFISSIYNSSRDSQANGYDGYFRDGLHALFWRNQDEIGWNLMHGVRRTASYAALC
jgi:hypothetical protein